MKVKDGYQSAHAFIDGCKSGMEFALKLLEIGPDRLELVRSALQEGIARQEERMTEMMESTNQENSNDL